MQKLIMSVSVIVALSVGYWLLGIEIAMQPFPARSTTRESSPDASGKLVADDTYDMVFSIYDAASGGNEKWSESHSDVQVTNGLFNVLWDRTRAQSSVR